MALVHHESEWRAREAEPEHQLAATIRWQRGSAEFLAVRIIDAEVGDPLRAWRREGLGSREVGERKANSARAGLSMHEYLRHVGARDGPRRAGRASRRYDRLSAPRRQPGRW